MNFYKCGQGALHTGVKFGLGAAVSVGMMVGGLGFPSGARAEGEAVANTPSLGAQLAASDAKIKALEDKLKVSDAQLKCHNEIIPSIIVNYQGLLQSYELFFSNQPQTLIPFLKGLEEASKKSAKVNLPALIFEINRTYKGEQDKSATFKKTIKELNDALRSCLGEIANP